MRRTRVWSGLEVGKRLTQVKIVRSERHQDITRTIRPVNGPRGTYEKESGKEVLDFMTIFPKWLPYGWMTRSGWQALAI